MSEVPLYRSLGFGVRGSGFGVRGFVRASGFGLWVRASGFRVRGLGFEVALNVAF